MAAKLLGDEQAGDLALHPGRDHHRARFGERLCPRGDVRYVTENLACRVHDHWTRLDRDTRGERWFARSSIPAVQLHQRALDRQRRAHRPLGVVLLRHWVPEQRHQAVAKLLGDFATDFRYCRRSGIEIRANKIAPFLGIEFRGNASRVD